MTKEQVIELMESSQSEQEWNNNCDIVKGKCDGYPNFWFSTIIASGLAGRVAARFGKDDKIHIQIIKADDLLPQSPSYTEDQEYSLVAVILVSLEQFSNDELAVFNLVMHTQGKLIPQHLCWGKAIEMKLVDENGISPEPELLKRALVHEVMKRKEARTF